MKDFFRIKNIRFDTGFWFHESDFKVPPEDFILYSEGGYYYPDLVAGTYQMFVCAMKDLKHG